MKNERRLSPRVICGYTEQAELPTSRLSYVNTNRAEAEKTQEAFCPGLRGIYIQTGMPDTIISRMILPWWGV